MSVLDHVLGWRASRLHSVKVQLPSRVTADQTPPSAPLATPVCGAVDTLTGATCTQLTTHPGAWMPVLHPTGDEVRWCRQYAGHHVDLSDPTMPVVWPDDDHTVARSAR